MGFEIDMLACAANTDAQQRYNEALAAEEKRLARETLLLAKAGNYERLFSAMDYHDNDKIVMRALVLCANKGNIEARTALDTLVNTYADIHAVIEQ